LLEGGPKLPPIMKCSNTCCSPPAPPATRSRQPRPPLARFGCLSAVLDADANAFGRVEGMGEVSSAALEAAPTSSTIKPGVR
jgi:hypothetical protein